MKFLKNFSLKESLCGFFLVIAVALFSRFFIKGTVSQNAYELINIFLLLCCVFIHPYLCKMINKK
ncbi:hypothetical protein CRG49_005290 [Neisseria sp. N95_16]|nr:hypothetical protein CRG49_005290 [Neisseria sp. N95_16]PJO79033.1 hypothetical protein CWC45_01785 [Neisseria sp. N177_16]